MKRFPSNMKNEDHEIQSTGDKRGDVMMEVYRSCKGQIALPGYVTIQVGLSEEGTKVL